MKVSVLDEQFIFLKECALYWPAKDLLVLSDVHLGKAESLQQEGIPIPSEAGFSDFLRLKSALEETTPSKVFILGDFIHNKKSWSEMLWTRLNLFFQEFSNIEWHLILGNHERGSHTQLSRLPLDLHEKEISLPPFTFSHGHQKSRAKEFYVEGHVHPVIHLKDGPLRLSVPCFVLEKSRLILPSFGTWTRGQVLERKASARYFAALPTEVFEVGS